jgi:hypothetical protein
MEERVRELERQAAARAAAMNQRLEVEGGSENPASNSTYSGQSE